MTKELGDHISFQSTFPRSWGTSSLSLSLSLSHTHTHTHTGAFRVSTRRLQPQLAPRERWTPRQARRQERRAGCRGREAGVASPGSSLQPQRVRGRRSRRSPRKAGCSPGARRRLAGSSSARRGPGAGGSAERLRALRPRWGRGSRRGRRTSARAHLPALP